MRRHSFLITLINKSTIYKREKTYIRMADTDSNLSARSLLDRVGIINISKTLQIIIRTLEVMLKRITYSPTTHYKKDIFTGNLTNKMKWKEFREIIIIINIKGVANGCIVYRLAINHCVNFASL